MSEKIPIQKLVQRYAATEGEFISNPEDLAKRCFETKALVFDWDGVFHAGEKSSSGESSFNEIDSMGVNLLRFALYLINGKIPNCYIITGELNPTARVYALREHFDGVYVGVKKKPIAFSHMCEANKLSTKQASFFFDDILDLEVAKTAGTRWMIGKNAYPLLRDYVKQNNLADYITGNSPNSHGLREATELFTGLLGQFENTLEKRVSFDEDYSNYWAIRNAIPTLFFTVSDGEVVPFESLKVVS